MFYNIFNKSVELIVDFSPDGGYCFLTVSRLFGILYHLPYKSGERAEPVDNTDELGIMSYRNVPKLSHRPNS